MKISLDYINSKNSHQYGSPDGNILTEEKSKTFCNHTIFKLY